MIDYTDKIKEFIGECTDLSKEEISSLKQDDDLNDFAIDSLSLVEIIFMLEEEFSIEIDLEDIDVAAPRMQKAVLTVSKISEVINEKLLND